jgi:hypothetical protein
MENSNDNIGNRTCDLPTCTAVPQPTALPRAPYFIDGYQKYTSNNFLYINFLSWEETGFAALQDLRGN